MGPDARPFDLTAAEAYERFLVPKLNAPQAREAVAMASLLPGQHVLDVACGTGIAIRLALPHLVPGGRAAGLDFDPAMIAVARSIVPRPDNVELDWHCASAMEMPFDSAIFDSAFCLQGLQFLPDCTKGLCEIRRVMKLDGRLVAIVWNALERCKGHHAIVRALTLYKIDPAPMMKALSMGNADRLQACAGNAGFRDATVRAVASSVRFPSARHFVEALAAGGPASRHALSKVPQHQRAAFHDEIASSLKQYEDGDGVAIPVEYLVLEARA